MITLFINTIEKALASYKPHREMLRRLRYGEFPIDLHGPGGFYLALIIKDLAGRAKGVYTVVTPTEQEAELLVRDLALLGVKAGLFPWHHVLPYRGGHMPAQIAGQRCRIMTAILEGTLEVCVTSIRALLNPLPPPDFFRSRMLRLKTGDNLDPQKVGGFLSENGYLRVPRVSLPGEFALRGEVCDLFMPGDDDAVRVVFEYERIEGIRRFDPLSQVSTESELKIVLRPAREVVWTRETLAAGHTLGRERSRELEERGSIPDEHLFFPGAFSQAGSIMDYQGDEGSLILCGYERFPSVEDSIRREYFRLYADAGGVSSGYPGIGHILLRLQDLWDSKSRIIYVHSLKTTDNPSKIIHYNSEEGRSFFGNITFFQEEISAVASAGYDIYVFTESEQQGFRIEHLLKDLKLTIIPADISGGFSLPDLKILVVHQREIFGRKKRRPESVKKAKTAVIDTFVELSPGDYIVHVNYGIGRYLGIERITSLNTERDYIKLLYGGEENVFIPIEQVNLIQRYIGNEGSSPRLDILGGKSWANRKERVKKSVEDLADRLIRLYSLRKESTGYAFPEDTDWQIEFEAAFPYEETEDQLRSIEEVKRDMEAPVPMDRLICGDVGYGKTEVAMRAVFKAVTGGKQAAVLAPTTILAEQHLENFRNRFTGYPVRVEMLSRFVLPREQKTVIRDLENGQVDLIIGTHRILQKDVRFKNLGLLIIDEEQRFGVKDKERLKELKTNVDCLTLSATPIPRTLHMSLLNIRDMSLITTPPSNRRPIETHIGEFDEQVIRNAILKEAGRGGQIYYLHNRIETLDRIAVFLKTLVPEVLVETAHGKMSSVEIEDVMHRFIHGAFQVLVSTTIIENGIDIPNVNTIIIDRADMYGISQLYQLRGRVGRSDRAARAYLFYPEQRALSELAMKRLEIISDYTELGSGFKIALKDLEIRGAGNLLGRQQHGDILSVGFDMYVRLLEQAVRERKETDAEPPFEVFLDLDYSGYIPDSYIRESTEKMDVYKKIASVETEEELSALSWEIEDRFGPLPEEVQSLLSLAEIRIICTGLHIASMRESRGVVYAEFARVSALSPDKVVRLIQESAGRVRLDMKKPNILMIETGSIGLTEKSEFLRERLSRLK
ncbi:MAG: transcription-repair coupling factor [Spirochaetales bacterium]|nr:transcription-repair coupling factor [Spirochaetales bacterium]